MTCIDHPLTLTLSPKWERGTEVRNRLAGLALPVLLNLAIAPPALSEPAPERQQELRRLLRHDCGSCHGLTLKGGLGPALTPEALAARPRELLIGTIEYGRAGTAMPPWQGLLSREDIVWMVDALRRGLPDED